MSQLATLCAVVAAYLVGAIPFGLLVARAKGVDIRAHGSGNIGATNVGRVLGRKYGLLVFALDFLKGVLAVAVLPVVCAALLPASGEVARSIVAVGCAAAAFVGHLFPVWLGFRGGRGVAVGAGAVAVLMPGAFLLALVVFAGVLSASRYMSLASLAGVAMLLAAHLLIAAQPWAADELPRTLFVLVGGAAVVVRHVPNLNRLVRGSEHRLGQSYMLARIGRELHLVALGLWLGSSVFFNLIAAPRIFDTFKAVVADAPSDRTAHVAIAAGLSETDQAKLASALAGAAVGPIFPAYFALSAGCALVALIGAVGWAVTHAGREDRARAVVLALAALVVAVNYPVAQEVTRLRLERLSDDLAIAEAARSAFGPAHAVSLLLSLAMMGLVGVAMLLAASLPNGFAGAATDTTVGATVGSTGSAAATATANTNTQALGPAQPDVDVATPTPALPPSPTHALTPSPTPPSTATPTPATNASD